MYEEATLVRTLLGWAVSGRAGWGPGDCLEQWEDALEDKDIVDTAGRANTNDDPGSTGGVTSSGRVAEDFPVEGVDLQEAHQSWKLSQHSARSAGFVTLFCFRDCSTRAIAIGDGTAKTAGPATAYITKQTGVNDADVEITPQWHWHIKRKPRKRKGDFAFLSLFF